MQNDSIEKDSLARCMCSVFSYWCCIYHYKLHFWSVHSSLHSYNTNWESWCLSHYFALDFCFKPNYSFGAELSKVYSSNAGLHIIQHFPTPFERFFKPLNKAGERLEQATKDDLKLTNGQIKNRMRKKGRSSENRTVRTRWIYL